MLHIEGAEYYQVDKENLFSLTFVTETSRKTVRDFRANICNNTVQELLLICKYLCVKNYYKLNKNRLVQIILNSKGEKSKTREINPKSGRCIKKVLTSFFGRYK